jgi:hypothetical protein
MIEQASTLVHSQTSLSCSLVFTFFSLAVAMATDKDPLAAHELCI